MVSTRTGETEEDLFSYFHEKGGKQLREITLIIPRIEVYSKLQSGPKRFFCGGSQSSCHPKLYTYIYSQTNQNRTMSDFVSPNCLFRFDRSS